MSYGLHHPDKPWQQQDNPELPDEPDINELIDSLPNEDGRLHEFLEDLLSGPEPEEPNPYHGTMYDFDDDAQY